MGYQSFYNLVNISVRDKVTENIYGDMVFTPTMDSAKLMTRLNLQTVMENGAVSLFYKEQYERLPSKATEQVVSFNNTILYFTFETKNNHLLARMNSAITSNEIPDTRKWLYKLGDQPERIHIYPAVFTHIVTGKIGNRRFTMARNGIELPVSEEYLRNITSNEAGIYHCTADLTNRPAGIYELLLEDMESFPAYIDTHNELPGKTGLLELVLADYNYTTSSNSSPPGQTPVTINYFI
jgi:hypothetical protein